MGYAYDMGYAMGYAMGAVPWAIPWDIDAPSYIPWAGPRTTRPVPCLVAVKGHRLRQGVHISMAYPMEFHGFHPIGHGKKYTMAYPMGSMAQSMA